MSDRWVVLLAVCAGIGASAPVAVPLPVALGAVVVALVLRSPPVACGAVLILTATLAARSVAGLSGVDEPVPVAGEVTLITDPERTLSGVRAEARLGSRRVELRARGVAADALAPRLAGEVVALRGDLGPVPGDSPWLASRHISGRLRVLLVEGWRPGDILSRVANAARRTLVDGTASMNASERSLFTGLVVGDEREQTPAVADAFKGAGLTHLLAVSGQNVAFVIALARPALSRLRIWPRWTATLGLIGLFGVMTRFEPSVLRASAMAGLAASTLTAGTPLTRLRLLALTFTGLLVIDPLLLRSVGFTLSVAATAAIVVLAEPIADALPGPRILREPLAVTVAAQLGVAPILLVTFGPMPLASLPANLLAVPAAGAVMAWGITAGMLAGVVGGDAASAIHTPTRLLLAWLAEVAERCAALPLGQLEAGHALAVSAGLGAVIAARRRGWPRPVRLLGALLAVGALAAAVLVAQARPVLRSDMAPGLVTWRAEGATVVVLGGAGSRTSLWPGLVLAELRRAGVDAIEVLVLADPSASPHLAEAVASRHPVGTLLLGPGTEPPQIARDVVRAPPEAFTAAIGGLLLRVTPTRDRLVVEATPAGR